MKLDGLFNDRRHDLVVLDYFLVYQIDTTTHAQLYANGLVRRIQWFVPTPYMLLLAQRATQVARAPAPSTLDRFVRTAAFLEAFDSLDAAPPTGEQIWAAIERFTCAAARSLACSRVRLVQG